MPQGITNFDAMAKQFVQAMPQRFGELTADLAFNALLGLLAVQGDVRNMALLAPSLRHDIFFARHIIQYWIRGGDGASNAACLPHLRPRLRDMPTLVRDVLPYCAGLFALCGGVIRDDRDCLRVAVPTDPDALAAASMRVASNIAYVGELITLNPDVLPLVPNHLRFNPTIRVTAGTAMLKRDGPLEAARMFDAALEHNPSAEHAAVGLRLAAARAQARALPEEEYRRAATWLENVNA